MDKMKKQKTREYLKYKFSDDEVKEFSQEMASDLREKSKLEDDKKSIVKDFAAKISKLEASINENAGIINSGFEMRQIDCMSTYDYDDLVIRTHREDTGELVKERDMEESEKQMDLPEDDEAPEENKESETTEEE